MLSTHLYASLATLEASHGTWAHGMLSSECRSDIPLSAGVHNFAELKPYYLGFGLKMTHNYKVMNHHSQPTAAPISS